MAYVERMLRPLPFGTIRTPVFAKVDCRRAASWPEKRYRLDPKFIRPQQTPGTLGFGRRQDFGGLGPIFKQAIVRGQ